MELPFEGTYWIDPEQIIGGPCPGYSDEEGREAILHGFLDSGIAALVSLQLDGEPDEDGKTFEEYWPDIVGDMAKLGADIELMRFPLSDAARPREDRIDEIMRALRTLTEDDKLVYLHCGTGHGRTVMVGACWLVESGLPPYEALEAITHRRDRQPELRGIPATEQAWQRTAVRRWGERERRRNG